MLWLRSVLHNKDPHKRKVQGEPSLRRPGLGWLWFWPFHCLTQFCLGRWEFGRIGWSVRQVGWNIKIKLNPTRWWFTLYYSLKVAPCLGCSPTFLVCVCVCIDSLPVRYYPIPLGCGLKKFNFSCLSFYHNFPEYISVSIPAKLLKTVYYRIYWTCLGEIS